VVVPAPTLARATAALMPLVELIRGRVLAAERFHGDDTTVPVLAKNKSHPSPPPTPGRPQHGVWNARPQKLDQRRRRFELPAQRNIKSLISTNVIVGRATSVSEASSLALIGSGLVGLGLRRRRQRKFG
jgi:hypothetical protein